MTAIVVERMNFQGEHQIVLLLTDTPIERGNGTTTGTATTAHAYTAKDEADAEQRAELLRTGLEAIGIEVL